LVTPWVFFRLTFWHASYAQLVPWHSCAQVDSDVIRLLGCWRSDEMLRYLHVQAELVMRDFARCMLIGGSFTLLPNQTVPNS
jgi:hypothetical protein